MERVREPVLVGLGAVVAAGYVVAVDPAGGGHYPACPFLTLTGHPCPLCGGLRAVHALGRGDVAAAVSANLMVVVLVLVAAVAWFRWLRGRALSSRWVFGALAAGFVVFGVVRNLPIGASLAP